MTARELIERIKDNPDGQILVRTRDGHDLPVMRVDEPYEGASVLYTEQAA
jgi:hypothetical protein